MIQCFNRQGEPLTLERCAELMHDPSYCAVAYTEVEEGVEVFTSWLGVDHNFLGVGPPLIFETMVFGSERDEEQHRYATEEEALLGHSGVAEMVSLSVMLARKREEPCV